jgi:fumarate hydratase class II
MSAIRNITILGVRKETDSLGEVDVPSAKLWGAQTQRSLEHFSIGQDLIPREMIAAYAILKKAAANTNRAGGRLDNERHGLIVQACDEILAGRHEDMFPLAESWELKSESVDLSAHLDQIVTVTAVKSANGDGTLTVLDLKMDSTSCNW